MFIDRVFNSWKLLKCSVAVIFLRKKLLVFPVVIFLLSLVMGAFFVAPVTLQPTGYRYTQIEHWQALENSLFTRTAPRAYGGYHRHNSTVALTDKGWAYFVIVYFLAMFLATFFNVAFYNEIIHALRGEEVCITRGIAFACTKIKTILLWSLFAGLVGLAIRLIENRSEWFGKLIISLVGIAWSVSSVFVIPVIVCREDTNPFKVLRDSVAVIKKTWGEALTGYVGLTYGYFVVFTFTVVLLGVTVTMQNSALRLAIIGFDLAALLALSYLLHIAGQVYKCALYLYAFDGYIPVPYDEDTMAMAWK